MGLKIEKNSSKLNKRIIPWNNWTQPVHYWHNDCEWQARIGIALIFFLRFLAVCEACQSFVMIFLINLGGNSWSDIDGELDHVLFTFMAVREWNSFHMSKQGRNWLEFLAWKHFFDSHGWGSKWCQRGTASRRNPLAKFIFLVKKIFAFQFKKGRLVLSNLILLSAI